MAENVNSCLPLSTKQCIQISIPTLFLHYVNYALERICSLVNYSSLFSQTCGIYSSYQNHWHFHFRRLKRARTQRHAVNAIPWTAEWENTVDGGRFVSLLPAGTLSGCGCAVLLCRVGVSPARSAWWKIQFIVVCMRTERAFINSELLRVLLRHHRFGNFMWWVNFVYYDQEVG